jgi:hypothetical protein
MLFPSGSTLEESVCPTEMSEISSIPAQRYSTVKTRELQQMWAEEGAAHFKVLVRHSLEMIEIKSRYLKNMK